MTRGKSFGLIEASLMSIQEFIIKSNDSICILTSFDFKKKKKIKFKMIDNVMYYYIFLYMV